MEDAKSAEVDKKQKKKGKCMEYLYAERLICGQKVNGDPLFLLSPFSFLACFCGRDLRRSNCAFVPMKLGEGNEGNERECGGWGHVWMMSCMHLGHYASPSH